MAEIEKSDENQVQALQNLLARQEAELVALRDARNHTIRLLHEAKLAVTVPSEDAYKIARNATPMTDIIFNKIGDDTSAIEEIISTVLNVKVKVKSAIPQYVLTNIGSRSVRLDNFAEIVIEAELLENCEWGQKGAYVNIEIQNEDDDDHEFRTYYNGASIIINKTPPNTRFEDLPYAIIIYIASFDLFGEGELLYENEKTDKYTHKHRRSPATEIFVVAKNLGNFLTHTDERKRNIASLMKVMSIRDWYDNDNFPALSRRKSEILKTDKGVNEVAREIQLVIDEQTAIFREETDRAKKEADDAKKEIEKMKKEAEEAELQQVNGIRNMKNRLGWSLQDVMNCMDIPSEKQARYAAMI